MQQSLHGSAGYLDVSPGRATVEEPVHQHGNVGTALAQCGQVHGHDIQTEIEVLAENSGAVFGLEIAVGGGDYPHVYFHLLIAAYRAHFLFLQYAQQLGLHFGRQFSDFVEKDGAPIGRLEESCLRPEGARKGPFLISEQFAFNERGDQRATIDGHERAVGERAPEMNGACHQFLPCTAFAGDQHWGARVLEPRDHAQDILDFRGGAHYAMELGFRVYAVTQELVLFHQLDFFRHAAQKQPQFFQGREWLADVVVGTQFHGLDCGFNRAMTGHDRDFGARQQFLYFFQKLQSRHLRHDHVGEDHVGGLFFQQPQCRFSAVRLGAEEAKRLPYRHAQLADALLVIHYQ